MRLKIFPALFILLIVLAKGLLSVPRKAPGFALMNNRGNIVFLSEVKGNRIISFFASYCVPCKREIPALMELKNKYARSKELKLLLVATDINDDDGQARDKAEKFLKNINVDHDFLLDLYHVAIKKYNPRTNVPSLFLVNRYGYIVFQDIGAHRDTLSRLEQAIQQLP